MKKYNKRKILNLKVCSDYIYGINTIGKANENTLKLGKCPVPVMYYRTILDNNESIIYKRNCWDRSVTRLKSSSYFIIKSSISNAINCKQKQLSKICKRRI